MKTIINKLSSINHPLMALTQLSIFCILLIVASYIRSSNITYFFLAWNLFLAWVPLFFAKIWTYRLQVKQLRKWKSIGMFCLWLLFFPNSPYIITDLVHLNTRFNPSIWSDTLLLFSCAFTGLIVGLYSLHVVHKVLERYFSFIKTWLIIITSLILTGFGIYLGRVQRWNSWDLFINPFNLIHDVFIQLSNPQAIKMTIGFSALLFIAYYMLKSITSYERTHK
ncbi:DUF1361 domain-containing protein [Fulvivirga sp. 29W222]|uniref:DUF1361 domain-containing protein n=1 Tax=Fulvivirga marina TaxID=2494733 RepID=A0A937FXG1_9BACT|nr:DUF1361 domain-containing protein [Fulvivirga marina]MBL6447839.1 DUF1361 domain-containing protein [Fulvivirga marina]